MRIDGIGGRTEVRPYKGGLFPQFFFGFLVNLYAMLNITYRGM